MTPTHPLRSAAPLVVLGALLLVAGGCGDSSGPAVPVAVAPAVAPSFAAAVGSTQDVVVRVTDARGRAARGVAVAWRVEAGGGTVQPPASRTDAAGEARTAWTLGPLLGEQLVHATVGGLAPVAFTAAAHVGPPASVAAHSADPVALELGATVEPPPAVVVRDVFGNPVAGATVVFAITRGTGVVTGAQQTTGEDGMARVGGWTVGRVGPNTLSATVGTLPPAAFTAHVTFESFDIVIDGVHLNQGSQTADGAIGGVSARRGLLRVVVRATAANTYAPQVRVWLYDGATLLGERTVTGPLHGVPVDPDLAHPAHTWNVLLEPADIVPGLAVVAVVDADDEIPVRTPGGKRFPRGAGTASLDVAGLHPLRVVFIPVHAGAQNRTGNITAASMPSFLDETTKWIPTSSIAATLQPVYSTSVDLSSASNWASLLNELQAKRTAEGARDEYYHGIVPEFPNMPWHGFAYIASSPGSPFRTAVTFDRLPAAGAIVAHELGHNMGRRHAPCGAVANPDAGYPHDGAAIGSPGFDIASGQLVAGSTLRDYMSYCGPQWTSDYTYRALVQWRRGELVAPAAAAGPALAATTPAPAAAAAATSGVLVWGRVDARGVVLQPAFAFDGVPVLPATPGPNVLRGTDARGRELFRYAFAGARVDHAHDPEERHFAFFVPLAPDDVAALATIEVTAPTGAASRSSAEVLPMAPGAAAPPAGAPAAGPGTVVERVAGDRLRLRWDAARWPMAMVRDPQTGVVLAFTRGGDALLRAGPRAADRVEVVLSDGVRSRALVERPR